MKFSKLNSKTLSQEIANHNISAIRGSVAFGSGTSAYYCRTGKHVLYCGHIDILNSNDAIIIINLPVPYDKLPIVARAFKGTGTYIQSYGEGGGLMIACGTGPSQVYFAVDYVCKDE